MNGSHPQTVIPPQLPHRVFLVMATWSALFSPVTAYLFALALGLSAEEMSWSLRYLLPLFILLSAVGVPWLIAFPLLQHNLGTRPGEEPHAYLVRLYKLPWKLSLLAGQGSQLLGGLLFSLILLVRFHKDPLLLGAECLIAVSLGYAMALPAALQIESLLMPSLLEERDRLRLRTQSRGPSWMRQSWHLPFTIGSVVVSALLIMGLLLVTQTVALRDDRMKALLSDPTLSAAQAERIAQHLGGFVDSQASLLGPPLIALGLFALIMSMFTTWMLARRQSQATTALREAIQGLANGSPVAPAWASTDELGDVATEMAIALDKLQEIPTRLQASASLLLSASTGLGSASNQQRQRLSEQAAVLQQAQLTSEEIRTTSELASHKAESVLSVAGHAEQLGQYGEQALERTLMGLSTIGDFVDGIRGKVLRLQESATQIAHIAVTVKDLADQSHLLALNASIEAARAGDQGAGFAVVASEIRKLADQTIRENALIRKSLLDIGTAIRDVVSMSEQGALQVEGGLERVKTSGNNLREMSLIIQENAAAVRQIAAAVNQQNAGITHIFNAIAHLSSGMDETMKRLDTTLQATETLQAVTREVTEIARRYQLHR
ncbi:methyl-accepting chemotaxis protein [Cystobacter fuscus]|uniref:methyl-accepting chemotaxis protein n=1 Tax=Cystobacter fuscus TaxID=43 RepID=UPI002B2FA009|nr:methyl-accepting chemotaxis protein [Cystobacter fuscus]